MPILATKASIKTTFLVVDENGTVTSMFPQEMEADVTTDGFIQAINDLLDKKDNLISSLSSDEVQMLMRTGNILSLGNVQAASLGVQNQYQLPTTVSTVGTVLGYQGTSQIEWVSVLNSGSVVSGNIASGQIGVNHLASGSVTSGAISSGQIGVNHLASGSVTSGAISSGQIGINHLASGSIRSGSISSGQIGSFHIASGGVLSGNIASGQIGINHLASGSVASGAIASGQIGINHLASGSVASGAIASGQIGQFHMQSGTTIRFVSPIISGNATSIITSEPISGFRAVRINHSGQLQIAMASVSGRMPAIGMVVDNAASGIQVNVFREGVFQFTSGMADYSGYVGRNLFVGRSGQIITTSGSFNSGGLLSGDLIQTIGQVTNSGAMTLTVDTDSVQAYPSILTATDGATVTFDLSQSRNHRVVLGGNRALALSNAIFGQIFLIQLVQDSGGSKTVTWFNTISWSGGSPPTLTATANKADVFGFICTGAGTFYGFIVGQNI